ncbi:hypothetical protein COOONC_25500 [Cooperia oncophora]
MDYPDKWPGFMDHLSTNFRRRSRILLMHHSTVAKSFTSSNEARRRKQSLDLFLKIEPLYSKPLVIRCSIISLAEAFSIHFGMLPIERLDDWIQFSISNLSLDCPAELDTIEDREERAHTVWWKCKKWAIKLLDRIFDRYSKNHRVFIRSWKLFLSINILCGFCSLYMEVDTFSNLEITGSFGPEGRV